MGLVASEALIVTKGSYLDLGSTSDFNFLLATTVNTKSTTVFIMAEATTSSLKRMD